MKKIIITLLCFLISSPIFASVINGVVEKLRGEATFNDKKISEGFIFETKGVLKTSSKAFVRIKIEKWDNTITLGPGSSLEIDLSIEC